MDEILTVPEAARYVHVGQRTIRVLVHQGQIPYARVGRRLLFRRSALDQWLATGGTAEHYVYPQPAGAARGAAGR